MADSTSQIAPVRGASRPEDGRRMVLVCAPGKTRTRLATRLRSMRLQVITAGTAEEARAAVLSRPQMILCDWSVDGMSAVDFTRECRADWASENAAIILVMVPGEQIDDAELALAAGADDFLTTPLIEPMLTARIKAAHRLLNVAAELEESRCATRATQDQLNAVRAATFADLANARLLQQGLIGARQSRFGSMELSLLLRPAGHIGGDLVGSFSINARRIGVYSIDVSGHGVAAALLTARLAAHLSGVGEQNIALHLDENGLYDACAPTEVARLFNRLILDELSIDTYFTLVYADIDVITGAGRLVQAGHPHPLLQRADGSVEMLGNGGLPIGLIRDAEWEEVPFRLGPGERVFISSDGISEATNSVGGLLGDDGVIAMLRTNAFLNGQPLLESICWSVGHFTQGQATDDISIALIERDPAPLAGGTAGG